MFEAEKVTELIAEARETAASVGIGNQRSAVGDLLNRLASALSSLRDAAEDRMNGYPLPTPEGAVAEIRALHIPKHGVYSHVDPGTGDHLGNESYVICDYDKTPWPCRHAIILGWSVPEGTPHE